MHACSLEVLFGQADTSTCVEWCATATASNVHEAKEKAMDMIVQYMLYMKYTSFKLMGEAYA